MLVAGHRTRISRLQSAQADFVTFQPRFQPPEEKPATCRTPSGAHSCIARIPLQLPGRVLNQSHVNRPMPIATINPATGETLQTFEALTAGEVDEKLQRAADAFERHRRTSLDERAEKMRRAGEILDAEKDRLARLMTT